MPTRVFGPRIMNTRSWGTASGLDPDAIDIIARMVPTPDAARQTVINNLILSLKAGSNNWAKLDYLALYAGHSEQASLLNWKALGQTGVKIGTVNHVTDRGFTATAGSAINLTYNARRDAVNFDVISNCYGVYSRTNVNNSSIDIGYIKTTAPVTVQQVAARTGGNFVIWNGTSSSLGQAVGDSLGLFMNARPSNTELQHWKSGTMVRTTTVSTVPVIENLEFYACGSNNTTALVSSTRQIAAVLIGGGDINQSELYTSIQAYMVAVGANV